MHKNDHVFNQMKNLLLIEYVMTTAGTRYKALMCLLPFATVNNEKAMEWIEMSLEICN